ncbi:glycosyltransferase family 2 protein [Hymenobacter busanensis]|uniref:Glycosyltransferase family 2 protein n=1 Tax=Hymenobacter busanensis TaxID=2607656 RepID=A0A7L4ZYV8_9BACT|nr:glycosyltransferase family 2 protein [Hymenobacter busanensis]KAA9339595.1 glycosyltransferase family 2 protein [Hymenobacter busanensis]QHJ06650.1 glycosyltransferase [Hymenobacter busanensis]
MPPAAPPASLPLIDVIIPAHNEALSIGRVLAEIPRNWVRDIIVVANACTDHTAEAAAEAGATVLREDRPGYGWACLRGMAHCYARPATQQPAIIVFLDGDYSDYPEELPALVQPLLTQEADFVIGSRALGQREPGSMLPQQIFGNWLATSLLRRLYGVHFTDLGPFRAIRADALQRLQMADKTYGWTVEMQLKAAQHKLRCTEVPVRYRRRIGFSKVSGTVKGTLGAGYKILWTIFRYL